MSAHLVIFERERPRLQALAYRLLGSLTDAEDLLQECFLSWQSVALEPLRQPAAYLTRMLTHRALDQLRSARHRRETYTGPWLPEPWIEGPDQDPALAVELADSLTMAFLLMLERLSPLERAVFVLRVVFDYEYAEIAEILDESQANCRQLLHRARQHLQGQHQHPVPDPERQQALLQAFLQACRGGELATLQTLLTEDAILYSDGGGKIRAALNPIYGAGKVARFLAGVLAKSPPGMVSRAAQVNGRLGLITEWDGQVQMVTSFDWQPAGIAAIYIVLNPDKLAYWQS